MSVQAKRRAIRLSSIFAAQQHAPTNMQHQHGQLKPDCNWPFGGLLVLGGL
jgi:hypothetical protein